MKINKIDRKRFRVRNKLKKVSDGSRYRVTIFRSKKNFYAQLIDDKAQKTLVSASSLDKDFEKSQKVNKSDISKKVGEKFAEKANQKNIKKIYFDRGIYKYHGRVKIFAETLRKNGMEF